MKEESLEEVEWWLRGGVKTYSSFGAIIHDVPYEGVNFIGPAADDIPGKTPKHGKHEDHGDDRLLLLNLAGRKIGCIFLSKSHLHEAAHRPYSC